MNISVEKAKEIREDIGATHLILFAMAADGEQNVSTHGLTEQHAHDAAALGNKLKKGLGWPQELCNSQPAQRENWKRKTADQINARIEELKMERQGYVETLADLGGPDDREEADALYVSMRQVDYAIEQLEWVLTPEEEEGGQADG